MSYSSYLSCESLLLYHLEFLTHPLTSCIALHSFINLPLVQIDNMADTPFKGAKIIRLKRSNLWDRYKSLLKAQETAVWHARDADQVEGKETMLTVPVEKMIDDVMWMKRVDDEADEWARTHASEVIFVDYEECKASPESCRTNMLEFLGVESNGQAEATGISAFAKGSDPLQGIENREEVAEALGANGFGSFVGLDDHTQLQLLIYETEPLETSSAARHVRRANDMRGINVTVIGQGTDHKGFGSKYTAALSGTYCNVDDTLFPPLSLPPLDTDTLSPCYSLLISYMIHS